MNDTVRECVDLYHQLQQVRLLKQQLIENAENDCDRARKQKVAKSDQEELAKLQNEFETLQTQVAELNMLNTVMDSSLIDKRHQLTSLNKQRHMFKKSIHALTSEFVTTKADIANKNQENQATYNRNLHDLKMTEKENVKLEAVVEKLLKKQEKLLIHREKQEAERLKLRESTDKEFAKLAKKEEHMLQKSEEIDQKLVEKDRKRKELQMKKEYLLDELNEESCSMMEIDCQIWNFKRCIKDNGFKLQDACNECKALKQSLQEMEKAKDEEAYYHTLSKQLSNDVIKYRNANGLIVQQCRDADGRVEFAQKFLEKLQNNESIDDLSTSLLDISNGLVNVRSRPTFMKSVSNANKPPNTFAPVPRRRTPSRSRNNSFSRSGSLSRLD